MLIQISSSEDKGHATISCIYHIAHSMHYSGHKMTSIESTHCLIQGVNH